MSTLVRPKETLTRLAWGSVSVGAALFVSKVAFAIKDVLVADRFGSGDVLDAFLAATILPLLFSQTIAIVLGDVFLPVFIGLREKQGEEKARRLLSTVLLFGSGAATLVALICLPFSQNILGLIVAGFTAGKLELAAGLFRWLLPFAVLSVWVSLLGSALVAMGRGQTVAATQILTPLVTMGLLLLMPRADPRTLAAGMVLGAGVEALVLAGLLVRAGIVPRPVWGGANADLRRTLTQFVPLFFAQLLGMGTVLVDQAMSAGLGPGAVSSLSFGSKVTLAVSNIAGVSLTMVVFPRFSQLTERGDWEGLWRVFKRLGVAVLLSSAVVTAALAVFSEPIIRTLFERGAFTAEDTLRAAGVQRAFVLQIPFFLFALMEVRLLMAMSRSHLITVTTGVNFFVNIVGNIALGRHFGVVGIALCTSAVMTGSAITLFFFVRSSIARARFASLMVEGEDQAPAMISAPSGAIPRR